MPAVVSLVLLSAAGAAPAFELHEEALPGGDTLVVVPDDRAPVVYVRIDFPVGDESPWGREHASDTAWSLQSYDPDGALRARADALAVDVGLGQSSQKAWLTVTCLKADLETALDLTGAILANEDFDRAELRRWRRGERLSWKNSQTNPAWRQSQAAAELLFEPDDPRRRVYEAAARLPRRVAGLPEVRDAILATPGRIVGVSGDVSVTEARDIAAALLPPARPLGEQGAPIYGLVTPPEERPAETDVAMDDLTQVYLRFVREGLTYDAPDYAASLVANHVLAGHAHARLGQALRYDEGSTYGVSLYGRVGTVPPALSIATYTRVENARAAEETLREALTEFHRDGITEGERAEAVTAMLGRQPFREQVPWNPLSERMWELHHDMPAGFRSAARGRAAAMSLEEINAFIARFYAPEAFVTVRLVPE